MEPGEQSKFAAAVTLSKGKMFEYGVPEDDHTELPKDLDLTLQFPLAIGTLGDAAADIVSQALNSRTHPRLTPRSELLFSAQVMVAFTESRADSGVDRALRLLAAAAFYLADSPGSATTLVKDLSTTDFPASDPLSRALRYVLHKPWEGQPIGLRDVRARTLVATLGEHFRTGASPSTLREPISGLRTWSYQQGSAHEVLLSDVLSAVALKRAERSAWTCLPALSELPQSSWADYLSRGSAVKEMWPAQRMLGDADLYRGESAVVQMPTSAGKTRATELVLRAAFASGRTQLAIVIAPFRALCQEIAGVLQRAFDPDGVEVNQLTDAIQPDYSAELVEWLALDGDLKPHIIVLTPEKLLYLLRQTSEFFANVGLVVYDEGHQFDSGSRGVTYELLLTSIKRLLPKQAQTLLISAVIKNSTQLAGWLLEDSEKVVSDQWLQTRRLVAFASFAEGNIGSLEFNASIEGEQEFRVSSVIVSEQLALKGSETKLRMFPERASGSVALYLGLKLAGNGGVAIYVPKPASATKIVRDAVQETFARGVSLPLPSEHCDQVELARLVHLYEVNFGAKSFLSEGARLGLFAHHGDTPQGIRLAIEHAMREMHIKLIVCTSTLAQGVNLPIRYLLITAAMQGRDRIKARDFHNLIGRAGRAGMYGEGTIVFTDHRLFDERHEDSYRWESAQSLLRADGGSATGSTLLQLFQPLVNDFGGRQLPGVSPMQLLEGLLSDPANALAQFDNLSPRLQRQNFSVEGLRKQLLLRRTTLEAVESFLMNNRGDMPSEAFIESARTLGGETFAHALATEEQREQIEELFEKIASRIERIVPDVVRQARFGRSLFGVDRSMQIDAWVVHKKWELQFCDTEEELFDIVWSFMFDCAGDKALKSLRPADAARALGNAWLNGDTYAGLLQMMAKSEAVLQQKSKRVKLKEDDVVGICDKVFGFEFPLLLAGIKAAFTEVSGESENTDRVAALFDVLQKRLKYGLPTQSTVAYFELGFSDRVVAQLVEQSILDVSATTRRDARAIVRRNREDVRRAVQPFPAYFQDALARVAP